MLVIVAPKKIPNARTLWQSLCLGCHEVVCWRPQALASTVDTLAPSKEQLDRLLVSASMSAGDGTPAQPAEAGAEGDDLLSQLRGMPEEQLAALAAKLGLDASSLKG